MPVAERNRQCIGCVCAVQRGTGQLHFDHMLNLPFVRVTDADNRFLDLVRGIFPHWHAVLRRHQHRNAPRLTELQRARPIFVNKGMFNGRLVRLIGHENVGELLVKHQKPVGKQFTGAVTDPICNVTDSGPVEIYDAPTHISQPGIDSQYPHNARPTLFSFWVARNENICQAEQFLSLLNRRDLNATHFVPKARIQPQLDTRFSLKTKAVFDDFGPFSTYAIGAYEQ